MQLKAVEVRHLQKQTASRCEIVLQTLALQEGAVACLHYSPRNKLVRAEQIGQHKLLRAVELCLKPDEQMFVELIDAFQVDDVDRIDALSG